MEKSAYDVSVKYTPTEDQDEIIKKKGVTKTEGNMVQSIVLSQHENKLKLFLKLLDRHFPRGHKFRKTFNRNTVKISCCYMKNMDLDKSLGI